MISTLDNNSEFIPPYRYFIQLLPIKISKEKELVVGLENACDPVAINLRFRV